MIMPRSESVRGALQERVRACTACGASHSYQNGTVSFFGSLSFSIARISWIARFAKGWLLVKSPSASFVISVSFFKNQNGSRPSRRRSLPNRSRLRRRFFRFSSPARSAAIAKHERPRARTDASSSFPVYADMHVPHRWPAALEQHGEIFKADALPPITDAPAGEGMRFLSATAPAFAGYCRHTARAAPV